ncbi:dephospho-CoA kinase [Agathobaculum sp. Marseille-P7918]|uniref:dephospho-CoA kinase n=1 Tax=Agathobaculum sp. Marseille-P7918 TaxID=2479843 RepID=UPI000F642494|nr:dephospho-CoA kinase [Agathobaculum sp. Marseille-P7918]
MRIIGLTGGSGTGKGTFAALLRDKGAGWVDADAVYRTLCAQNRDMLHALDTTFGGVLDEDGALDRPKLAAIVFSDPEKLAKLNEITLPYIRAASMDAMRAQGDCPFVLYDAPTLFEVGADDLCERVIGVLADTEVRVQRIMARDGLDEAAARARVAAQPDADFYRARCQYIVENNGGLADLQRQADAIFEVLRKGDG